MSNIEKYKKVFQEILEVESQDVEKLKYQEIQAWDSIGHMNLIAELENVFEIEMETEDIIEFSDFQKGMEILQKYDIQM